ncbi:MAG: ammonium transporter [Deltaproteobacteria bacterium]|nr:ammonium transporter [Deltaproteobacteria bacterium]
MAGIGCYFGIMAKNRFGYDDSLDVVGIHGVGGVLGLPAANGLFFGNPAQFGIQALAVLVTIVYAFAVSWVLLKVVDGLFGLRVSEKDEVGGLDLLEHDETAYNF